MPLCLEGNNYGHRPLVYLPSLFPLRCALSLVMHASVVVPVREHCTGFPAHPAYGIVLPKAVPVLSSRKNSEGFAVRLSSYVNVLMLLLLACLPKRLFFCSQQYKLRSHAVE